MTTYVRLDPAHSAHHCRLKSCSSSNNCRHVLRSQGWEWEPEGKYYWKNVGEPMHEEAFLTLSEAGIVIPSDEEEESAEGVEEEVRRPQRKRRRLNEDQGGGVAAGGLCMPALSGQPEAARHALSHWHTPVQNSAPWWGCAVGLECP